MGFSKPTYFTCLTTWWDEQQSNLICQISLYVPRTFLCWLHKSAEHSLVLKIDIHCTCWWEHSELVCSFSTHSYQILSEGAWWENREVGKVVLHAETKTRCPQSHLENLLRLSILLQILTTEERQKKNKPLLHLKLTKIPFCTENGNYGMKPFQTLWEQEPKDECFQLV